MGHRVNVSRVFVRHDVGMVGVRRAILVTAIVVVSVLFGLGADAVLASSPKVESVVLATTCSCPSVIAWPSAVVLTLLIINGLRLRVAGSKSGD